MARAHSQGQLICWDEDDDHGIEDIGAEDMDKRHGMTDSSDSFICINEEDAVKGEDDVNEDSKETVVEKNLLPSSGKEGDDDSDWEKWDDEN